MAATMPLSNIIYYDPNSVRKVSIAASETIYRGAMVEMSSTGAKAATDTDPVLGFAIETVANTAAFGGGAAGDKFVLVARRGQAVYASPGSLAVNTVVYPGNDDDSVASSGTVIAGRVAANEDINPRHGISNAVVVDFDLGS